MAFNRQQGKQGSEPAEKGKVPDWTVRARASPGSDFYLTLGAGWNVEVNGQEAISLRLQCVPVGWGRIVSRPDAQEERRIVASCGPRENARLDFFSYAAIVIEKGEEAALPFCSSPRLVSVPLQAARAASRLQSWAQRPLTVPS